MSYKELKFLLIQIRKEASVRQEELDSFVKFARIKHSELTVLNVFDTPQFNKNFIEKYDATFIGGASEASVLEERANPFLPSLYELINYSVEISHPVFASCFGFQAAIKAFGGEILQQFHGFEMGTYPISLTSAAKKDLLYKDVPDNFYAVSVHKEYAKELPKNCELLGRTKDCLHTFKVKNKPFWAFQFHPELDTPNLIQRLKVYQERYTDNLDHFHEVINNLSDTPESNALVYKFVNLVRNGF